MGKLYFDISDLIDFFRGNHQATGIQRVQLNILSALVKLAPGQLQCVAYNEDAGRFRLYPAQALFKPASPPAQLLQHLSNRGRRRGLLNKASVRRALQQHNHRKVYRSLKKIELYLARLFAPEKLAALGYHDDEVQACSHVPSADFESPEAGDIYIVLGHNWKTAGIHDMARRFRAHGGHAVQVIHDVIAAVAPQYFPHRATEQFTAYLQACAGSFDTFICVSNNTARDLRHILGDAVSAHHIRTLRLAHTYEGTQRNASCPRPHNPALQTLASQRYVLCVGTVEPRKNGVTLLQAWEKLHSSMGKDTPTLVFAGKLGWKIESFMKQLEEIRQKKIPVVILNDANDTDLHFLYSHCMFTVYPSRYEGWGLPVGESAWLGKTCLASRASSIPEVCGDAIEYFDPTDPVDISLQLEKLCRDESQIRTLEQRIRKLTLRTWDDVAHDFLDIMQTRRETDRS